MRIVFMGTPEFAVPSLEALLHSPDEVVGVVTQPDRPKGRGHEFVSPPVKIVAERAGIPVLQPVKIRTPEFLAALNAWKPDMIAVTAFGRILHAPILSLPPLGCINVHGSLLPKYRGAAPVQWAVMNGETETGITTMVMDEGMDTGPMLLQETLSILPEDTSGTLAPRLAELGGRLLVETIARLKTGTVTPQRQDESQATLAPLLKKEDGLLDWSMSSESLHHRIRGLSPWPGAYTFLAGERWNIWKAVPHTTSTTEQPGCVVSVSKQSLFIATGRGLLELLEIQPANSKRMPVASFLSGHPVQRGSLLGTPSRPH